MEKPGCPLLLWEGLPKRINPRECLMLRHSLIWGIYTSVNVYVANEGNV
jgi:hypothetical protein